jgi:ribulose-bisphosphate carboxylase large chain
MALNQSNRYVDLTLKEDELIRDGKHVLVAYHMKPKAGFGGYVETAAHFAAESSTGTNVEVSTTDAFTRGVDAIVYVADEERELIKLAYPVELFDRNITDGRAMIASFLTLAIGNNQGMGDVEYAKMHDFYFPPEFLRLFDGPATTISDLWRVLGRPHVDGGFIVGTIVKPKLGLRPRPFADACYEFWKGGDFIKNDEPQGNQVFAPMKETIPLVADTMRRVQDETGEPKLFSANITADDPFEMIARGEYILETFAELSDHVAFLVDGYVAGPTAITTARRRFPNQYLHYHRAGHGAVTSPQTQRGYTAFVHCKMARIQGSSGIHTGTMSFGKMEGETADKYIAYMLERDSADGPYFHQDWQGMNPTTAIISGGMNALRIPGFFENLGHNNVIMTAGGGSYGHVDGAAAGARSMRQAAECWKQKADPIEFAREHPEFARAFESFPHDADMLYPGWKQKLALTA